MNDTQKHDNPERKEDSKLETYRLAIKDARHVFTTYHDKFPAEAWETIKKIIFNPALK